MTDFAQLRGLVRKSAAWHLHETKSLCCQMLCPLILLALVLMLQLLVIDPLQADLAAGDTEEKARIQGCVETARLPAQSRANEGVSAAATPLTRMSPAIVINTTGLVQGVQRVPVSLHDRLHGPHRPVLMVFRRQPRLAVPGRVLHFGCFCNRNAEPVLGLPRV